MTPREEQPAVRHMSEAEMERGAKRIRELEASLATKQNQESDSVSTCPSAMDPDIAELNYLRQRVEEQERQIRELSTFETPRENLRPTESCPELGLSPPRPTPPGPARQSTGGFQAFREVYNPTTSAALAIARRYTSKESPRTE